MTPEGEVFVIRRKDGRYLYAGTTRRGQHLLVRSQRLARRFEGILEAWEWVAAHSYTSGYGTPKSHYRPVKLVPRVIGCCRRCA